MAIIPQFKVYLPETITILVHGLSDSGKTVLGSCSPDLDPKEPILIEDAVVLDVEGGTVSLPTRGAGIITGRYPEDPFQVIHSKEDLGKAIDYVRQNKGRLRYATLDTLDRFQEYALDTILKENNRTLPEQRDWLAVLLALERFGRTVPTWGVNVVVLAHSDEAKDDNDKVVKLLPNIRGQFKSKIGSYFDVVAYLERKINPDGSEKRILYTKGTTRYFARSRLGSCLPSVIDNPTIPALIQDYLDRRSKLIETLRKNPRVQIVGREPEPSVPPTKPKA